jgi:hypothetical protein
MLCDWFKDHFELELQGTGNLNDYLYMVGPKEQRIEIALYLNRKLK